LNSPKLNKDNANNIRLTTSINENFTPTIGKKFTQNNPMAFKQINNANMGKNFFNIFIF